MPPLRLGRLVRYLEKNKNAIQIGLTATPRQIRLPEPKDEETRRQVEEDRRLLADNLRYFGEPAYEYTYQQGVADGYLAPAEIETYDLFHDQQDQPERIRGVYRVDLAGKNLTNALTGEGSSWTTTPPLTQGSSLETRLVMPDRVEAMCAHLFNRLLQTGDGDPLQKTIIFCASDHHADLVTNEMNGLYAKWCRETQHRRIQTYSFKCMASSNGQELIPDFRERQRSHFVATTRICSPQGSMSPASGTSFSSATSIRPFCSTRWLAGHPDPRRDRQAHVSASSITPAHRALRTEFVSPPPPPPGPDEPKPRDHCHHANQGRGRAGRGGGHGPLQSHDQDGRLTRVTPQEYQQRLIDELTAAVPTLAEFRARWLDPGQRKELMTELAAHNLMPELCAKPCTWRLSTSLTCWPPSPTASNRSPAPNAPQGSVNRPGLVDPTAPARGQSHS